MNRTLLEIENLTKSSCELQFEMIHIVGEISELESSLDRMINELKKLRSELYSEIEKIENEKNNHNHNLEQNQ